MIRKLTLIMILAALSLTAGPASALFDDTVINPRARAMGEASVSVTDGAFAAFANAGQLGRIERGEVARHVRGPAEAPFVVIKHHHRYRRFRRDAADAADHEAIEHHVADNQNAGPGCRRQ